LPFRAFDLTSNVGFTAWAGREAPREVPFLNSNERQIA
jgi:hypothetical protein